MTEPNTPETGATFPVASKFCGDCGAPLTATARFCQSCGTAVAAIDAVDADSDDGLVREDFRQQPLVTGGRGLAATLPWVLALVGLVGGSAYFAGQETAQPAAPQAPPGGMVAPFARGGGGAPPDIASMSPNERANRLYGRIMQYVTAGKADSAAFFAPMALAAHEMLESPSADERYHLGQINEMIGNAAVARAQSDTILKAEPDNLLGLMLAVRASRMANKPMDAKPFERRLLLVLEAQLASKRPEYDVHRAEIDRAAAEARTP